jgi:hypothetical protein
MTRVHEPAALEPVGHLAHLIKATVIQEVKVR